MNSSAPASATRTHAPRLWPDCGPVSDLVRRTQAHDAPDHAGPCRRIYQQLNGSEPTRNQALAALRRFFDAMAQRHAIALNPFASVRSLKYSVTEGKTADSRSSKPGNNSSRSMSAISSASAIALYSASSPTPARASAPSPSYGCRIIAISANTTSCASRKRAGRIERFRCGTT